MKLLWNLRRVATRLRSESALWLSLFIPCGLKPHLWPQMKCYMSCDDSAFLSSCRPSPCRACLEHQRARRLRRTFNFHPRLRPNMTSVHSTPTRFNSNRQHLPPLRDTILLHPQVQQARRCETVSVLTRMNSNGTTILTSKTWTHPMKMIHLPKPSFDARHFDKPKKPLQSIRF